MISKAELEAMGCISWVDWKGCQVSTSGAIDLFGNTINYRITPTLSDIIMRTSDGLNSFDIKGNWGQAGSPIAPYVIIPDVLQNETTATVFAWIKSDVTTTNTCYMINQSDYQFRVVIDGSGSTNRVILSGTQYKLNSTDGAKISAAINTLEWVCIAVTIDCTNNTSIFYLNGEYVGEVTTSTSYITTSDVDNYGIMCPGPADYATYDSLDGVCNNWMLFDEVLTEEQIKNLYNKTYIE